MNENCFQNIILKLQNFWAKQGCVILQPYDVEVGAGTFHPATTLKSLGSKPWKVAYVQPCRRPTDGRYGENPNRVQHYYQFQVLMKPCPENSQELCLESLYEIGIDPKKNDLRFVEDNWEGPTLGASGLGWELWLNGLEVLQYTYFQQVGGIECSPVPVELTYGLERLVTAIQDVDSMLDIDWNGAEGNDQITYRDVFLQNEKEFSAYNFDHADTNMLRQHFNDIEQEAHRLLEQGLTLPAYDQCLKASHMFNLLDARGVVSVTERADYIARVRNIAKRSCENYLKASEETS